MFYIDINRANIVRAREEHYRIMRYIIKKKLNGPSFSEEPPFSNMNRINKVSELENSILDFFNNDVNLEKVLIGTPRELDEIKDNFSDKANQLKKILNYDTWINTDEKLTYRLYNAYHLAQNLDIPTCPYCGRMYTKTVGRKKGDKITRPTFDHWFPKSKYPLLALSFYNLIPSCHICNSSLKGDSEFSLKEYFHPYHKTENLKYTFSYDLKSYHEPNIKIKAEKGISENSVKAFELEEIYKTHNDELEDLLKVKQAYSEKYIDTLNNMLGEGITLSKDEIYRLAFGAYMDEDKFDRRPLSKMKKDILTELGIVQ